MRKRVCHNVGMCNGIMTHPHEEILTRTSEMCGCAKPHVLPPSHRREVSSSRSLEGVVVYDYLSRQNATDIPLPIHRFLPVTHKILKKILT